MAVVSIGTVCIVSWYNVCSKWNTLMHSTWTFEFISLGLLQKLFQYYFSWMTTLVTIGTLLIFRCSLVLGELMWWSLALLNQQSVCTRLPESASKSSPLLSNDMLLTEHPRPCRTQCQTAHCNIPLWIPRSPQDAQMEGGAAGWPMLCLQQKKAVLVH